jgi:anti-sigma B factor antagonist
VEISSGTLPSSKTLLDKEIRDSDSQVVEAWRLTSPRNGVKRNFVRERRGNVDLDIKQSGTTCILKLKGRLMSGEAVNQFESAFQTALANGQVSLILDLEALPYIDSSGIGSVVNALRMATKAGGSVKLVNPAPFVAKTFKMVGILSLFGVYETEEDAVVACGG